VPGEPELGDEPAQLHRLADTVEARLRRAQEETEQATQALTQVQGVLVEKRSAAEQEKLALQVKFDEEKAQATTRKGTVARGATRSKRNGQQSTSLCDSLRNKGRRSSSTASEPT
jgi:hypothetical protein